MTFSAEAIAKKYDGSIVGGAVVATIDGKKEYLTVFRDGVYVPTELLLSLEATAETPVEEAKPKKAKKVDPVVEAAIDAALSINE